jgi:hypothetical protein
MRIQQRMVGNVAIIDLTGRLMLGDGDELLRDKVKGLIQQGQKRLVLNLTRSPVSGEGPAVLNLAIHTRQTRRMDRRTPSGRCCHVAWNRRTNLSASFRVTHSALR